MEVVANSGPMRKNRLSYYSAQFVKGKSGERRGGEKWCEDELEGSLNDVRGEVGRCRICHETLENF